MESEVADLAREKGWFKEIEESWVYGVELNSPAFWALRLARKIQYTKGEGYVLYEVSFVFGDHEELPQAMEYRQDLKSGPD